LMPTGRLSMSRRSSPSAGTSPGGTALFAVVLLALLASGSLLGLRQQPGETGATAQEENAKLRIVLTGNSEGQLRVCRCSLGQHGGWERLATALKGELSDSPVILLDAGAFVRPQGSSPDRAADSTFRILKELGYSAVNVAEHEMGLGSTNVSEKAQATGIPALSANIVDSNGTPVFEPFVVKTLPASDFRPALAHDLRVGVLGLTSAACNLAKYSADNSALKVQDPIEAAREQLPMLAAQADLVIVLCDLEAREIDALVAACPQIDAVACGRRHQPDELRGVSKQSGKTLVFYGGKDLFQHYGLLEFSLDHEGRIESAHGDCRLLENGKVAEDPQMTKLIGELLRKQASDIMAQAASRTAVQRVKPYAGFGTCRTCHADEFRQWETTKHARAFQTLTATEQLETDCVSCHTTGFGNGGFVAKISTPKLTGVQCEACHGAGGMHVADTSQPPQRSDPMSSCTDCHTERRSPNFEPNSYRSRILHTAGHDTQ
jgi:2',3'-cyclic-nucleotide 2'-phosphodiesterase (5'-nucleotidase family)